MVLTIPLANTCGSVNTSAKLLIGPQGTLAAVSASNQSDLVRVISTCSKMGTN